MIGGLTVFFAARPTRLFSPEISKIDRLISIVVEIALPTTAAGKAIEVWFQDEARVGQKGAIEYIGARPPMVRDNRHGSVHIFGAIVPGNITLMPLPPYAPELNPAASCGRSRQGGV